MLYVAESRKSVEDAARDLEAAVKAHKFGVLHVHDLKATMNAKGVDFPHECKILEVCNPQQAAKVLTADMSMNVALPCRISVYEEGGVTKIGMARPTALLGMLSTDPALEPVAKEVEAATIAMIEEAK